MNFGTIGTSKITTKFIEASRKVEGFDLTAVYSRSNDKAKQFQKQYQASYAFTNLEEMALSNEIDCVYIASPNSLHYEQAILFLKHKKHVICEKPVFSNTKELKYAYKIAEENGVYLFEAIRNIHSPNFKTLKNAIKSIGEIRSISMHRSRYSSKYDEYLAGGSPNVFSTAFSGGALTDMGIYALYLVTGLFGKPKGISYTASLLESGVDGSGTLVLNYDSFLSTVMCSKISTSYIPCEIQGEKGSILFYNAGVVIDMKLIMNDGSQDIPIETYDADDDMKFEIHAFLQIITNKDQKEHDRLKELSLLTLSITEEARRQTGIRYDCEK